MSLVRSILEYGSARWDSWKEGQINALDRVEKTPAQFTNHTKDSDWETWLSVGRYSAYVHLLKRTRGTGMESYARQVAKALLFE